MNDMSLTEKITNAIQFSLYAMDTLERRQRIIADVKRAINNNFFENVIEVAEEGQPVLKTFWQHSPLMGSELHVIITKPKPELDANESLIQHWDTSTMDKTEAAQRIIAAMIDSDVHEAVSKYQPARRIAGL